MIYFKRFLWLAAWSVWVWLGFGLYRELPRDLGPPICTLPVADADVWMAGFFDDSNEAAFFDPDRPDGRRIAVYDAESGTMVREIQIPANAHTFATRGFTRNHGVIFVLIPVKSNNGSRAGLHALDLRDGRWQFLSARRIIDEPTVHPNHPWVAFVERPTANSASEHVAVYDFRSGRELFVSPPTPEQPRGYIQFLPGSNRIIFSIGPREDVHFEVWHLGKSPTLEQTLDGGVIGQSASTGEKGRLASTRNLPSYAEVFSIDEERVIFSAGERHPPPSRNEPTKVLLSRSGKALLGGPAPVVWNVDGGPPIWVGTSFQMPYSVESNEVFMVVEQWYRLWEMCLPRLRLETWALRRLDSGELLYRTYTEAAHWPSLTNSARTLVIVDGAVHRLPLPVNWPLVALCQTILALPLVLPWALLRWRRKRKAIRTASG